MEAETKKTIKGLVVIMIMVLLALAFIITVFGEDKPQNVQLEILEDIFIDVDGDGDLDFVHSIEFVRQDGQRVTADPYPAPPLGQ